MMMRGADVEDGKDNMMVTKMMGKEYYTKTTGTWCLVLMSRMARTMIVSKMTKMIYYTTIHAPGA